MLQSDGIGANKSTITQNLEVADESATSLQERDAGAMERGFNFILPTEFVDVDT
jgi:hypothetical protein